MKSFFSIAFLSLALNAMAQSTPIDTLTARHPEYLPTLKVGMKAPELAAPDTLGNVIKLTDFQGTYVVLDFWASWCGDCRHEIPFLKTLFKDYRHTKIDGKSIEWLSLSFDNKEENWKNLLRKEQFEWTQISNLKSTRQDPIFKSFGLHWIPAFFIISPDGIILGSAITTDSLRRKLEKLTSKKK